MAQPGSSLNFLIHDASGQQQVYKVMQSGQGKPLTSASVKAIVKDFTNQGQNSPQIIRTINGQKLFGVQPGSKVVTLTGLQSKAIRLTPEQMSAFKIVQRPASAPQKNIQVTNSVNTPLNTSNIAGTNKKIASSSSHHNTVQSTISRRRKTDKVGKGLRHFSMKVCEKVKEKGTTTYNEVADELVAEEIEGNQPIDPANYDQKNIRRRVYDALNVLMAMNIISKEKKEIRWIGLPTNSAQQCNNLEKENEKRRERIESKQQQLRELILQQVSFKSLVTRNKEGEERGLIPTPSSAIQLPFIIVNTTKKTNINCSISNDKSEYLIKFDDKFEIHDDVEVLKKMGLLLGLDKGECTYDDIEKAKKMVPKAFEKYIEIYGKGLDDNLSDYDMSNSELIDINQTRTSDLDSDSCDVEDDEEDPASDVSDAD